MGPEQHYCTVESRLSTSIESRPAGMILDVTRWLPEHPGGSAIIPAQALNIECSRFFELYHVSRESFLYIEVCGYRRTTAGMCSPAASEQ